MDLWKTTPHTRVLKSSPNLLLISSLGERIRITGTQSQLAEQILINLGEPRKISTLKRKFKLTVDNKTFAEIFSMLEEKDLIERCTNSKKSLLKKLSEFYKISDCEDPSQDFESLHKIVYHEMPLPDGAFPCFKRVSEMKQSQYDETSFLNLLIFNKLPLFDRLQQVPENSIGVLPLTCGFMTTPILSQENGQACCRCILDALKSHLDVFENHESLSLFDWRYLEATIYPELYRWYADPLNSVFNSNIVQFNFLNHTVLKLQVFPQPNCQCSEGYQV